jgi:UDP-N-acetylmuramate: L-alanyl-gamma-D-glutamyl-meso-diaminopimelate ligase
VFQDEYGAAFDAADQVVLAPPGDLDRIAPEERFDIQALAQAIRSRGRDAWVWGAGPEGAALAAPAVADAIVAHLLPHVAPEDVVAILSNGGFGGLHQKLLQALGSGSPPR